MCCDCNAYFWKKSYYIWKTYFMTNYKPGGNLASLQWRHNGHSSVSNHQYYDCLHNRLFRRRSKQTSKLRVTGLCVGNSLGTGEFPAQMASNADNVSIWYHHVTKVIGHTWVSHFRRPLSNKMYNFRIVITSWPCNPGRECRWYIKLFGWNIANNIPKTLISWYWNMMPSNYVDS